MHLPQEVITTIEHENALERDPSSDIFILDIPYSVSKAISFKDESETYILEPIAKAAKVAIGPSTSKSSVPLKSANSRIEKIHTFQILRLYGPLKTVWNPRLNIVNFLSRIKNC